MTTPRWPKNNGRNGGWDHTNLPGGDGPWKNHDHRGVSDLLADFSAVADHPLPGTPAAEIETVSFGGAGFKPDDWIFS